MKNVVLIMSLSLLVFAGVAYAQGQPSAKATFAFNELISLPSCAGAGGCVENSGWTPILTQEIKMANSKDLFIDASLQCGIVTDTTVKSLNGSEDSAEARATIRVRVALFKEGELYGYAEPDAGRNATGDPDADGVVFCDRIQTLVARFSGLNCTADLTTGAVTCADPEQLELILKTLNANAFNFVAPDLAQGVYTVQVQARTSAAVSATGANGSLGRANAFIGAGSVAIESVRMIKGEQVEF